MRRAKGARKSVTLEVRVTQETAERLARARGGMTISNYLRSLLERALADFERHENGHAH